MLEFKQLLRLRRKDLNQDKPQNSSGNRLAILSRFSPHKDRQDKLILDLRNSEVLIEFLEWYLEDKIFENLFQPEKTELAKGFYDLYMLLNKLKETKTIGEKHDLDRGN